MAVEPAQLKEPKSIYQIKLGAVPKIDEEAKQVHSNESLFPVSLQTWKKAQEQVRKRYVA